MCNSTGKRCARERLAALFVASLPAVNCQQQKPLANVTSYYLTSYASYPSFFFVAFSIPCSSFALLLFLVVPVVVVVVIVVTETLVYKTPTRTYSARICMQSISLGNRVTSAYREGERERESAKAFREENPRDRPVLKIRQNER